ncbi:MAG: hypothetical protein MJ006_04805, partial [Methanocorpusculum sp.]|nr:hypothetical protein [Methanocorpusculum sp.]
SGTEIKNTHKTARKGVGIRNYRDPRNRPEDNSSQTGITEKSNLPHYNMHPLDKYLTPSSLNLFLLQKPAVSTLK